MPAANQRLLLVCQLTAAEAAAAAARRAWGAGVEIDLLCYGRSSKDHPPPALTTLIQLPVQEGISPVKALRILAHVSRRRYDAVALSQPALGLSRARALLLAFSGAVGRRRAVILDPEAGEVVRPITFRLVALDVTRWALLQALSRACAAVATVALEQLGRKSRLSSGQSGATGSVLYLRTDIELRIAPLRTGGSLAHTEGILVALENRGHDVTFLSTGEVDGVPRKIRQRRLPALLRGNLPTEIAELISGLVQGATRLKEDRPSAFIYQRYSLNNLAGVILSSRWKVPLILEANASEARWRQEFSVLRYPRLAYACERLILRRSLTVSAVSANAAENLLAAGGPADRLRVVPNGVSVSRFADATPISLPWLDGSFVVCFVGLFYPWHGVRSLAEAFALLHRRRPDARLLLVGDGEEAPVVRSELERRGALEATEMVGLVPRRDAPRYMAAAEVLVSPHADVHHFIGSPIKLFEYMASGKPIVATRVGQIQDLLRNDETALLVEPGNPEVMAAALERLYLDRELGRRLGAAAQAEAHQQHSWDARLAAVLDGLARDGR